MRYAERPPSILPKVAISAALISLAVVAIHLAPEPSPPYKMVDEVALRPTAWDGERVRVHGWVTPGTIVHVAGDLHVFSLQRNGQSLRVWYRGPIPDTFKDQSEAIVLGRVIKEEGTWWIEAYELKTKCGGKYDGSVQLKAAKYQ